MSGASLWPDESGFSVVRSAGAFGCNPEALLLLLPPSLVRHGAPHDRLSSARHRPQRRCRLGARGGIVKRVAVVGSGIAGLATAHALTGEAQVTLYEAGDYFGGHTHTVDVTLDGVTHGVDTGFLVFNERTYPNLIRLFGELGVVTSPSDMSFSVQVGQQGLEWSGSSLDTVFAQRRNLLRPRFWRMLAQILRFNRLATALAERGAEAELAEPIGDFLDREGFGPTFRDWYFLPMIGCIWSCPTDQMLRFPIATLIRFCHNHGLIQVLSLIHI